MNVVRKTATTLGGLFFAVLLIAMLAPKAAHGVAAALVQVTNTSTNPVPTVASDSPANFPFGQTILTCFDSTGPCGGGNSFTVPTTTSTGLPVKRLVIENVSGSCNITAGVSGFLLNVAVPFPNSAALVFDFPLLSASPNNSPGMFVLGGTSVRIYANPGDSVVVGENSAIEADNSAICSVSLMGHLETK
jgi:hypothetical protein